MGGGGRPPKPGTGIHENVSWMRARRYRAAMPTSQSTDCRVYLQPAARGPTPSRPGPHGTTPCKGDFRGFAEVLSGSERERAAGWRRGEGADSKPAPAALRASLGIASIGSGMATGPRPCICYAWPVALRANRRVTTITPCDSIIFSSHGIGDRARRHTSRDIDFLVVWQAQNCNNAGT